MSRSANSVVMEPVHTSPQTALSLPALHSGGPNAQQYTSSHTASCIVAALQLLQTRAQEEMSGGERYPNVVRRAGDSASRRNARRRSELWFTLEPDPMVAWVVNAQLPPYSRQIGGIVWKNINGLDRYGAKATLRTEPLPKPQPSSSRLACRA